MLPRGAPSKAHLLIRTRKHLHLGGKETAAENALLSTLELLSTFRANRLGNLGLQPLTSEAGKGEMERPREKPRSGGQPRSSGCWEGGLRSRIKTRGHRQEQPIPSFMESNTQHVVVVQDPGKKEVEVSE